MPDPTQTFGVLGALQVRRDGLVLALRSGRQRAVLAALLVSRGRPVAPDSLVEAAWPERLPASPLAALHTVVSRLRHTLGDGFVRSAPAGYVLDAAPESVDCGRFEALVDEAAVAASAATGADLLDEALGLWRGRAYEEFADRPFAQTEAVRLDELRLAAIEDRAEIALRLGEPARAVADLEAMLAEHPLRERARGLLMTALYGQGRHVAALECFRAYRRQLAEDRGLEPSPSLQAIEVRILNHDLPDIAPARPLGVRASPSWAVRTGVFVGRDDESARLVEALRAHRLVTITGVGGVGKTRLVAETVPELSRRLGLPATVVELAAVVPGQVAATVAAALGLAMTGDTEVDDVVEYLSISSGLLVLDDCEHVLDEVARLVGAVLDDAPAMRVLATSRRRIGLGAEQLVPLPPLTVPDLDSPPERAELSAAVRLFADRARRLRPGFALDPDQVEVAAEICRRLDGIPLVIELAASRSVTLGLRPVLDRLTGPLDLLGDAAARGSRTLREVIAWSYRLLDADERRLLAAVSVFGGDFDLAAIEAVADAIGVGSAPTATASLVDASLVAVHDADGVAQHRLLAVVRAFAAEQLATSPDEEAAHLGHAQWVQQATSDAAAQVLCAGHPTALWTLERHQADVAAALQWSLASDHPDLAARVACAVSLCAHWRPGAVLLARISDVARDERVLASAAAPSALAAGAAAALHQGDIDAVEDLAAAALERVTTTDERALALLTLAVAGVYRGQHDRCAGRLEELLAVPGVPMGFRMDAEATAVLIACYAVISPPHAGSWNDATVTAEVAGASAYRAFVTYAAGEVALAAGERSAIEVLRAAVDEAEACAASQVAEVARIALVSAHVRLGHRRDALDVFPALIDDLRRMSNWTQLWTSLRILAELLAEAREDHTSALLLSAASMAPAAPALTGADVARYNELHSQLSERLGPNVIAQISELAAALPRAQIVEPALTAISQVSRATLRRGRPT